MSRRTVRTVEVIEITCESCGRKLEIHADHAVTSGWVSVLVCVGDHTSAFDFCKACVKVYTDTVPVNMHNPPDVWSLIHTAMVDRNTETGTVTTEAHTVEVPDHDKWIKTPHEFTPCAHDKGECFYCTRHSSHTIHGDYKLKVRS